jgi:excisionase family DNA binding protein
MAEELIKPSVAAKRLGIARATIYKWIAEGRIGSVEIPGGISGKPTVRIPRADLEAFEKSFKHRPAGARDVQSDDIQMSGHAASGTFVPTPA